MAESIFSREDIREIDEEIQNEEGFFLCISILTKEKKIKHYFISENFQKGDFKRSLNEMRKLVKADLYKSGDEDLAKEL